MAIQTFNQPFRPINSTAPSFRVSVTNASTLNALESTSLREWPNPANRTVRVSSIEAGDYSLKFGTSDAVAASTDSMMVLGGTVEVFEVLPSHTHIAMHSSTDVTVNVTLGKGH